MALAVLGDRGEHVDGVRFGVIGTGYWAREVHAAGIASHPDAQLVGVWGRDPAKAATLAQARGAEAFDDLDAMLAVVDAVAFSVPPQVQAELAPRVADAGRHLLLEKPLALEPAAAQRVVDAVERNGVAAIVFFTERYLPDRENWLGRLVAEGGALGGEAAWLGSLLTPDNPFADSPWRKSEGALWDVCPHSLAGLLPVLGPVRDVVGVRGFDDLVHLTLTHDSGATSHVAVSLTMPPDATRTALQFYRADGWHTRPEDPFEPVDAHRNAVGELIDLVRSGRTRHRCDVRLARDIVDVLDRAQRALD
jgi:predicted dehydrogenase